MIVFRYGKEQLQFRYFKEQEIKTVTIYKSYDSNIDSKDQVRDLGIMVINTATSLFILEI